MKKNGMKTILIGSIVAMLAALPMIFNESFLKVLDVIVGLEATQAIEKENISPRLIQSIKIDKSSMCSGETNKITVTALHPTDANIPVDVWIDGIPGATQEKLFLVPHAAQSIHVVALADDGMKDEKYTSVEKELFEIKDCSPSPQPPIVGFRANPYKRYTADFRIIIGERTNKPGAPLGAGQFTYNWDFGDGSIETTDIPVVTHNYSDAMDHSRKFSTFQVKVTRTGKYEKIAKRTISVLSQAYLSRSRGFLEIDFSVPDANVVGKKNISYLIKNPNNEDIQVIRLLKRYYPCDPEEDGNWKEIKPQEVFPDAVMYYKGSLSETFPSSSIDKVGPDSRGIEDGKSKLSWKGIKILKGRSTSNTIPVPYPLPEICVVSYHLIGKGIATALPAYGAVYLKVRRNRRMMTLANAITSATLEKMRVKEQFTNISLEELDARRIRGELRLTPNGWEE